MSKKNETSNKIFKDSTHVCIRRSGERYLQFDAVHDGTGREYRGGEPIIGEDSQAYPKTIGRIAGIISFVLPAKTITFEFLDGPEAT